MDFALRIELGNDAMKTRSHLAKALREVAERLEKDSSRELRGDGSIKDINGNTVGGWVFDE